MHHLPEQWDTSAHDISAQMQQADIIDQPSPVGTPVDEFPTLSQDVVARGRRGGAATRGTDPSRARFALAVKKAAQQSPANLPPPTLGAHFATTPRQTSGGSGSPLLRSGPPVARASPRLKLRPPTLLPTLSTGAALNEMYLAYRARAIKLGGERHACLSRAAEAWRRGDGAAAKQFSLQGAELNAKMGKESAEAVARLMRERSRLSVDAVRNRDTAWSDDPRDRSERGKLVGGSLGVCLGVAPKSVDAKATPEERMEGVLDLHGLHATEATEVLETFLLSVSRPPLTVRLSGPLTPVRACSWRTSTISGSRTSSWARRSTRGRRTRSAARRACASPRACATGSTNGAIPGRNATVLSAWTRSRTRRETHTCRTLEICCTARLLAV